MSPRIYTSDDSVNNIIYQEMMAKARENPLQGLPVEEIKRQLAASYKTEISGRQDFHPLQKEAFKDIGLIQTAKEGLSTIAKAVERLRVLDIDALRNITTRERQYLDDEYQYLKQTIRQVGVETKINGISLLDVDPETLKFRMNPKVKDILGTGQFLFGEEHPKIDLDPDEDWSPLHSITSEQAARESLMVLRLGSLNLGQVDGALTGVENRLVTEIRKFSLDGRQAGPVSDFNWPKAVIDTANEIVQGGIAALDVHHAGPLAQLGRRFAAVF